jgi:two-component system, NarL family, nitrate/nitrite response regulator NarL
MEQLPSVLIVDDDPTVRDVMATIARAALACSEVLCAADAETALRMATANPHLRLILVDPQLSAATPTDIIRKLRGCCPRARILALLRGHSPWPSKDLLEAGAAGLIFKEHLRVISLAVQMIMAGGTYIPLEALGTERAEAEADAAALHGSMRAGLTKRRLEVLRLILQGCANSAIAAHLSISEGTVKQHIHAIFTILGVTSRTQAAAAAMKLGLGAAAEPPRPKITGPLAKDESR